MKVSFTPAGAGRPCLIRDWIAEDDERAFSRRRGQNWAARVIDLDIVLWSGGTWGEQGAADRAACRVRARDFVLRPLLAVAPDWRDPVSRLRVRQLAARLRLKVPSRRERQCRLRKDY